MLSVVNRDQTDPGNLSADCYFYQKWFALFFVVALILFSRQPDAILKPAFFAEDGCIFFEQQFEVGFPAALVTQYAGYYHLAPRLVAGLVTAFPLEQIPRLYAAISLLIAAAIFTFFFAPIFRQVIRNDFARALVVICFTLMPNGDPLMRLSYLCWYLLFFMALITLMEFPRKRRWQIALFIPCFIAIWSAPLVIACVPMFFYRLWKAPNRAEKIWWLALIVCQIFYDLSTEPKPSAIRDSLSQQWFLALVHAVGYRVFAYFYLSMSAAKNLPVSGWRTVDALALFLLLVTVCSVVRSMQKTRDGQARFIPPALLYLILALPALFVLRPEFISNFLVWLPAQPFQTWSWHQRYFFSSTLLLCILAGVFVERVAAPALLNSTSAKIWGSVFFIGWLNLHSLRFPLETWHTKPPWSDYCHNIRAASSTANRTRRPQRVHVTTSIEMFDFDLLVDASSSNTHG